MRGRVVAIVEPPDRPFAAALVIDGQVEDLIFAPKSGAPRPMAGEDVTARVTRKLPKSGAFCSLDGGGQGYLRDARSVSEGEEIAAQVQSLPEPGKALTLTTRRLIKGPRVIVTPGSPGVNVSKKIGNPAERERLEAAVRGALSGQSESLGAIVRTSAKRATGPELAREIASLLGDFPSPIAASVRDWLVPTPDAILAPEELARHWLAEPSRLFGDADAIATLHADPDAFDAQGIWEEIENLKSPEVSVIEGSMVLEPTRALVAVDVNSGGDFSSAAGLKVNIAVARALPRQLRLRGLGGKIAVDFAPMPKQHRRTVEEALAKAFRADPIETALVGWTSLGLFEIQRKRERWPLMELL